jgi:hypothetical protein
MRNLREEEKEELIMIEGRLTLIQQMNSFLKVGRFSTYVISATYFILLQF